MDPTVVSGERGQFKTNVRQAANNVSNRAAINAEKFATQVESACEAFRNYTRGKIEKLADQVTSGDLLAGLAGAVLSAVGGKLAEKAGEVTCELGKEIVTAIQEGLKDKVGEQLKAASPESKDLDDLKEAVDKLAMAARDGATGVIDMVSSKIDPAMQAIIDAVNNDQQLTPDQDALISPFYEASASDIDKGLEGLGVPSVATAKQIQLDMFKGLVEKFQEKLILATASLRDEIEISTADVIGPESLSLHGRASRAADQATRGRAAEMDAAQRGSAGGAE